MSSRRSSFALLLAALALLVRLLAPGFAEARSAFDPLADAPICTHDGVPSPAGNGPTKDAHETSQCALSCCQVAPALLVPPAPHATVIRALATLAWRIAGTGFLVFHAPAAHRARGPPSVS